MIERYEGENGARRLLTTLLEDRLVAHDRAIADRLVAEGQLRAFAPGETLINQGDHTSDVFFIIAGSVTIIVNGKPLTTRSQGLTVGEMSAIEPSQPRSATVVAADATVVLQVSEASFIEIGHTFPEMWRRLAASLARRLLERNRLVSVPRTRVKVFIMSSVEALPIVDLLIEQFAHDPFLAVAWKNGVFRASHYTLDELDKQLDDADFAVALAHTDDIVTSRKETWPVMRDNVVFELGMFMGRLGRHRAFLMEPRDSDVRLPSDLTGMTTIPYRYEPGNDASHVIAPAAAALRRLILASGAKD
jgi:predicted nucleotide-binding protein